MKDKISEKYLVVEVHDVTPQFKLELTKIVSELDNIGITKKSFLVIPNYSEKNKITEDKGFVSWLCSLYKKGDEIVQHGYNHISTNYNYKSSLAKFIGTKVTHGQGEFQNISYNEANFKIKRGRDLFNQAGLWSSGFVAPAWLLNPESERAIKDAGFDYYTGFRHIYFPKQNKEEKAETIVFTSGRGIVNKGFALYNHDLVHRVFKKRRIARVAVHPKDLENPDFFDLILDSIKTLKMNRVLATCEELALKNEN